MRGKRVADAPRLLPVHRDEGVHADHAPAIVDQRAPGIAAQHLGRMKELARAVQRVLDRRDLPIVDAEIGRCRQIAVEQPAKPDVVPDGQSRIARRDDAEQLARQFAEGERLGAGVRERPR